MSQNSNIIESFKDCSSSKMGEFITAIEKSGGFERKSYIPVDDKSHFERFQYLNKENGGRISIVFDTKANILSITSAVQSAQYLKSLYQNGKVNQDKEPAKQPQNNPQPIKQNPVKQQQNTPQPMQQNPVKQPRNNSQPIKQNPVKQPQNNTQPIQQNPAKQPQNNSQPIQQNPVKQPQSNSQTANQANNSQQNTAQQNKIKLNIAKKDTAQQSKQAQKPQLDKKTDKQVKAQKAQEKSAAKQSEQSIAEQEYKDGIAIKNYNAQRFNRLLELIKNTKGLTLKVEQTGEGTTKISAYRISNSNKQKLYLRYLPQKETVQLQGKESELSRTIQALIYKSADYKTAVNTYIKQVGEDETLNGIEKKLKKLIPSAFDFLSEQSKKDLIFALIDINNEETRLSDYSGLLVSPYRGLERLIYDLQIAQGISVKMIGQAYEKTNEGVYNLKSGYRKKIPSVIYNEVMSALYSEYFEKRNFYLHSDNSETGMQRAIREKSDAKRYFDKLLEIIDYNCKKLREIQFTPVK